MTSSDDEATLKAKLDALRAQYRLAVAAGDEKSAHELRQRRYEVTAQLWQARRNAATQIANRPPSSVGEPGAA